MTTVIMAETAMDRHLLGLDGMSRDQIISLLDRAQELHDIAADHAPPLGLLKHHTIANIFFENSTRTRCSFTMAARRLGGETLDVLGEASSAKKGETLLDTCLNLKAMGCAAFVIRIAASGAPHQIAQRLCAPVINAGDGRHEHPTQGLLDLLTLRQRLHRLEGRTIAIVGDVANSRVARSALFGLTTLGANVLLVGPPRLAPSAFEELNLGPGSVRVVHDLDDILAQVDAVMMLRVQFERDAGRAIASIEEYRRRYALTSDRVSRLRDEAIILHPGPINRGLELDSAVADDPGRSVILEQVTNGVAVRMAVLERALWTS